jgi:hypothetical protein
VKSKKEPRPVKRLAVIPVTLIALVLYAAPAWANHVDASGTTSCSNGAHVITWTITNGDKRLPMTVDAEAKLGAQTFPVEVTTNPVPALTSSSATSTVPGDLTGTVTLDVTATWSNGIHKPATATVDLTGPCPASTTTAPTTVPGATTSGPTTVPPTGVGPTSTTAPTSTSAVAGVSKPPSPVCGGPGQLACTGSPLSAETAAGLGAVGLGAIFLWFKRRNAYRIHE